MNAVFQGLCCILKVKVSKLSVLVTFVGNFSVDRLAEELTGPQFLKNLYYLFFLSLNSVIEIYRMEYNVPLRVNINRHWRLLL